MTTPELRLADLLASLSLAADLGNGLPIETTLRVCLLATRLARAAGASDEDVVATYYTGLLWSAGCTSTAHEEHVRFGDDVGSKRAMGGADFERPADVLRRATQIGRDWGVAGRAQGLAGALRYGKSHSTDIATFHCEAGARLAARLGLGASVLAGLGTFFEYWDGKGGPAQLRAEAIPFAARAARVAFETVHAIRLGNDPRTVLRARAGRELDPQLTAALTQSAPELLSGIDEESVWAEALDAEPHPRPWMPDTRLDDLVSAFADFVDLKSVWWLGHSRAVAALAGAAADACAMPARDAALVRSAASLHGLGRVSVSNRVWDKRGALSAGEWERVRLYPYFTDRVLGRAAAFANAARIASGAQERLDGSGYHRGIPAAAQPATVRLLAAAAAYQSMTEARPYRESLEPSRAADELRRAVAAGALDGDAVAAVLETAGHRARRGEWPTGLTGRSRCCGWSPVAAATGRWRRGSASQRRRRATTSSTSTKRSASRHARARRCSPWSTGRFRSKDDPNGS